MVVNGSSSCVTAERFVQLCHRGPKAEELLLLFRCAETRLHLGLPGRSKRRAMALISVA